MAEQPHAIVRKGKVERRIMIDPADIPAHKANYILPITVDEPRPVYDPSTHILEGGKIEAIFADRVEYTWATPRLKTAQELDDDKEARLPATDELQFKVLFNHENRIRALEGAGAVTAPQFRAALKAML